MKFELISLSAGLLKKQAVNDIVLCNNYTERFGLMLTQEQAAELVDTRFYALNANGRIELGGGVIDKMIKEFCDSPYISMYNYASTLHELIELFYYYKNETIDLISDDDLINMMKSKYDGICRGSLDLLEGQLYLMARNLRFGLPFDYSEDSYSGSWEDYDDEEWS